jgi:hypothetical protein
LSCQFFYDRQFFDNSIQSLIDLKNEVVIIAKAEEISNMALIPFSQEEPVLILPPNHHLKTNRSF